MQSTLIDQGLNLMLYGMGTVFVFLTILVFATRAMSFVVNRLSPEQASEADKPANTQQPLSPNSLSPNSPSPDVLEAIKQAIAAHRSR